MKEEMPLYDHHTIRFWTLKNATSISAIVILSYFPMAPALNMLSLFEVFHQKIVAEIYGFLV